MNTEQESNAAVATYLGEAEKATATDCCGYISRTTHPVKWNPFNREVQCHNCGAVWKPKTANVGVQGQAEAERCSASPETKG